MNIGVRNVRWLAGLQRLAWVGLWLLILGGPLLAVAWYVAGKHRFAQRNLEELAPRYARLQGIVDQQAAWAERADQAAAALALRVLPASEDPQAATNEWLQRVRSALEAQGMSIESSQAEAPQDDGPLRRLGMTLVVDGDLPALARALSHLRGLQPPMHVLRMALRTTGPVPPNSNPRLKIQLQLAVYQQRLL